MRQTGHGVRVSFKLETDSGPKPGLRRTPTPHPGYYYKSSDYSDTVTAVVGTLHKTYAVIIMDNGTL